MKLIKLILIMIFLILCVFSMWTSERAVASEKITVEPYFRIRMAIQADNGDAQEVVNQIHNTLMEKGIVISKNKKDPVVEGRVVVESREKNKVNPYGIREFTQHAVVLVLKSLKIKDSLGTILASYQSFSGFGSHEMESQSFTDAAEQIVEQLKETNFVSKAAKVARRQDIIIKTSSQSNKKEVEKEICDVLNNFMIPVVEELQLTRNELKTAIESLAKKKAKKLNATYDTVYINGSELDKIIVDHNLRPMKASYKYYEFKEQSKYNKNLYKEKTGIIIEAQRIKGLPRLRLQRIYSEGGALVFGGKRNPNFNPLLHFESKENLLTSDYKVEAKNPIIVQATRITDGGHIVVSERDANEILLANKWGGRKIFSEGRIFVLTGTD